MRNITRQDLAQKINDNIGLSTSEGYDLVDLIFNEINSALLRGEEVKIQHFGTFRVLDKKERIGRNPKNGVEYKISARKVVSFKPSNTLKTKIDG